MKRYSISTMLLGPAAAAAVLATAGQANAGFSAGNIVVVQVGNGTNTLGAAAAAVTLREFSTTGSATGETFAVPSSGTSALTLRGSADAEGVLTRSTDGRYLTLAGYRADAVTATDPRGTSSTGARRTVGLITQDTSGVISADTSTSFAFSTNFQGDSIRSAFTDDGNRIWVSGATGTTGGVRYTTLGQTGDTTPLNASGNTRAVRIINGQLYAASGSATPGIGIHAVGTGTPTTGTQTFTNLIPTNGLSGSPQFQDFFFADLGAASWNSTGFDTLYAADSGGNRIAKYSFNGTAWSLVSNIALTNVRNLIGQVDENGNVTLFGTTTTTLFKLTDATGTTGALATGNLSTLATAGTNFNFRGLAFSIPTPGSAALLGLGGLVALRRRR